MTRALRPWTTLAALALAGCATTIYPGEVGVRSNFGRIDPQPYGPGVFTHSPVGVRFYRIDTRTQAIPMTHALTSRRGARIEVGASVVYSVRGEAAPALISEIGTVYERELLDPVFRWATQQVYAEGRATTRDEVGTLLRDAMNARLAPRGIVVDRVILERSALASDAVYAAFQERMVEEQRAQQMKFDLDKARSEAERVVIEAQGKADAHAILQDGLTRAILQSTAIDTFLGLVSSPNARLIVTDGPTPLLIDGP